MKRRSSRMMEPISAVVDRDKTLRAEASKRAPPVAARHWEAAVGTRIAARARPMKLDRGVLVVRAASATWAQELTLLADAILSQLRARGVAVDSLRFFVGTVDPPERPPWRQEVRTSPPSSPLPPDVKRELARVADPELRDAIARAASKNLGWQVQRVAAAIPKARSHAVEPPTSETSSARGPRSAASESARPDQSPSPSAAGQRGTSGKR